MCEHANIGIHVVVKVDTCSRSTIFWHEIIGHSGLSVVYVLSHKSMLQLFALETFKPNSAIVFNLQRMSKILY